uniref:Uncharacterized protein n=1 Tax=Knipowitschia caucasica TaxID=637954 RepID=A0AAV2KJU1_KNICA
MPVAERVAASDQLWQRLISCGSCWCHKRSVPSLIQHILSIEQTRGDSTQDTAGLVLFYCDETTFLLQRPTSPAKSSAQ